MTHYNLALLGFGNVGQALALLLNRKRDELNRDFGITFTYTGIATGRHGMAIDRNGIDVEKAIERMADGKTLDSLSAEPPPIDAFDFIQRCHAQVLFENTPVNYQTGQPAVDHLELALSLGMEAITANKGPVVHAYRRLTELAQIKGRHFFFESTVMDGAPIFSLFREALPSAQLLAFKGILNSTTNLILTRMETGQSFAEALGYAQTIGIAETDPSGDIDGWDAAVKVAALVTVLMGTDCKPEEVDRNGIRGITQQEIARARQQGCRWKLVCSARRLPAGIEKRVAPEMVLNDSPLYAVNGTSSLIQFETDVLGTLSMVENDPGPETTAYGLLADFINAVKT
jgi:homoserine dehydrogenase